MRFAAPLRAPRQKVRSAREDACGHQRAHGPHEHVGEQCSHMKTTRKIPVPGCRILSANGVEDIAGKSAVAAGVQVRDEPPAEQVGGLNRHADAFGNNRMRFGSGIADRENPVTSERAYSRAQGARGQPPALRRRRAQSRRDTLAGGLDVRKDRRTCACAGQPLPRECQLIAPDAAREADPAAIGMNHAAITTRKRDQRHQVRGQRAVYEMRFETKQIIAARRAAQWLARHRTRLPGAMRCDDEPCAQMAGLRPAFVDDRAIVPAAIRRYPGQCPWLPDVRTQCRGALKQQCVQVLAAQRPAAILLFVWRQGGAGHDIAGIQPDSPHHRSGNFQQRVGYPQFAQQRPSRCRNEFSADFSPWEQRFFNKCNAPACLRKQRGRRGTRWARADNNRVVVGFHRLFANGKKAMAERASRILLQQPG